MKDNFSENSEDYLKFRPTYPEEVFQFIISKLKHTERAWDVGTGNGQVSRSLSKYFESIEATDISSHQLKHAFRSPGIQYSVQPAEKTNFKDDSFDLIISAQAVHWFRFDEFFAEANRCLKPGGLIVIMGYGLVRSDDRINRIIDHFYTEIIGKYWDEERKYLDNSYQSIPFPFTELQTPGFTKEYEWSIEHFLGYLRTWSSVKHYRNIHHSDPVKRIEKELRAEFGDRHKITFPIFLRMGSISRSDQ
ncbi:class I SAM-dependent methyltransferase [Gramella sp. GC03-9]|uniref:Class I SAM-dependent methyltransferase n=1 Tax=Christiangramia oceanisediminis TaxID=2920386 RepID=A0A9X2KY34_9FLAO|nr:class I SAM-dependent methyltransferase [Gramella oceanisediminis]MCP9200311.1 class I SAM-dependent methyltransferase [Gramella oceanisediminis]